MVYTCNGLCVTGPELGIPAPGIAYPHPDCDLHGDGDKTCTCTYGPSADGPEAPAENCPRHGRATAETWEAIHAGMQQHSVGYRQTLISAAVREYGPIPPELVGKFDALLEG